VIDGTYLTEPHLVVNTTGQASNIAVITGFNRDEAGVLIDDAPENGTTFAAYAPKALARYGLHPGYLASLAPSAFALTNASGPDRILNATSAVSTLGEFGCWDMAKALSGVHHAAFGPTYVYAFNRTYQTGGYTRPWCVPPKDAAHPDGDPEGGEYYKCHAGEQLVTFGNARRAGRPDRDGRDTPFMRLVVDYWAAFARTGDPNPAEEDLSVRGHWDTLERVRSGGKWEAVNTKKPSLRLLQWNGRQMPFAEMDGGRCRALGIPLDVLETWS